MLNSEESMARAASSMHQLPERLNTSPPDPPTLSSLCLSRLEASLGKDLDAISLQNIPLGLAETIYKFVFSHGSQMAQMAISRTLAPLLCNAVTSMDCSNEGGENLGNSALLELTAGCSSGLKRIDLSGCYLVTDDVISEVLAKCTSLVSLSLSGCTRVTDEVVNFIPCRLAYLRELNLAGLGSITPAGMVYISYLTSIEQLCLSRCAQINDEALSALEHGNCHTSLRWLDLAGTAVTEACFSSLRRMTMLQYLSLSATTATVRSVASFARGRSLNVASPHTPKTRARSNRILFMGTAWSKRQFAFAHDRTRMQSRVRAVPNCCRGGTPRQSWKGNPNKVPRLENIPHSRALPPPNVRIEVHDHGTSSGKSKDFLNDLVNGIVRLWQPISS